MKSRSSRGQCLTALGILPASILFGAAPVAYSQHMSVVGFQRIEVLGYVRPIIEASINGFRFPMMIHSNAGLVVQLRHDQAKRFRARHVRAVGGRYGIVRAGKISQLPPSRDILDRLIVGNMAYRDVPISVRSDLLIENDAVGKMARVPTSF